MFRTTKIFISWTLPLLWTKYFHYCDNSTICVVLNISVLPLTFVVNDIAFTCKIKYIKKHFELQNETLPVYFYCNNSPWNFNTSWLQVIFSDLVGSSLLNSWSTRWWGHGSLGLLSPLCLDSIRIANKPSSSLF